MCNKSLRGLEIIQSCWNLQDTLGKWALLQTYLRPQWTWGRRRTWWRGWAGPWSTALVRRWWYWYLHKHSWRCLPSRHLDGEIIKTSRYRHDTHQENRRWKCWTKHWTWIWVLQCQRSIGEVGEFLPVSLNKGPGQIRNVFGPHLCSGWLCGRSHFYRVIKGWACAADCCLWAALSAHSVERGLDLLQVCVSVGSESGPDTLPQVICLTQPTRAALWLRAFSIIPAANRCLAGAPCAQSTADNRGDHISIFSCIL